MPTRVESVRQLAHPCRARAVFLFHVLGLASLRYDLVQLGLTRLGELWQNLKHRVQAGIARHHHAGADKAALVECSQGIKVAVEGLILGVPLQVERDPPLHVVDLLWPSMKFSIMRGVLSDRLTLRALPSAIARRTPACAPASPPECVSPPNLPGEGCGRISWACLTRSH